MSLVNNLKNLLPLFSSLTPARVENIEQEHWSSHFLLREHIKEYLSLKHVFSERGIAALLRLEEQLKELEDLGRQKEEMTKLLKERDLAKRAEGILSILREGDLVTLGGWYTLGKIGVTSQLRSSNPRMHTYMKAGVVIT